MSHLIRPVGRTVSPSAIRVEMGDLRHLPIIQVGRKLQAELCDCRQELIRAVARMLADPDGPAELKTNVARGLGWRVAGVAVNEIRIFREDNRYLVGAVPVTGAGGRQATLALILPVADHDLMGMMDMVRDKKALAALKRLRLLPHSYGLYLLSFEGQGGVLPLFVREYIKGDSFHQLCQAKLLTDRHIFAIGEIFGKLLPLANQALPISLQPEYVVFTATGGKIRARVCGVSQLVSGVGLAAYLRHGLHAGLFRLGLTNRHQIRKFVAGLVSALPPNFLRENAQTINAELAGTNAQLSVLRKLPQWERIYHNEARTRLFLYKALLIRLSTLSA